VDQLQNLVSPTTKSAPKGKGTELKRISLLLQNSDLRKI